MQHLGAYGTECAPRVFARKSEEGSLLVLTPLGNGPRAVPTVTSTLHDLGLQASPLLPARGPPEHSVFPIFDSLRLRLPISWRAGVGGRDPIVTTNQGEHG